MIMRKAIYDDCFLNDNYVGGEIHFAEIDKVLKNQPALFIQ